MAIAIVQSKALAANLPVTLNSTSTAGNTIIWVAGCANNMTGGTPQYAGPTWDGVSQAQGFPLWNLANSNGVINGTGSAIYCAGWVIPNCPAGTSLNFSTVVPSYTDGSMILEVSGLGNNPTIESVSTNTGNSTGARSSGVAKANVGYPAIIIGGSTGYGQAITGGAGFTNFSATGDQYGMGGYRILTTYGEACSYDTSTVSGVQLWATGVAVLIPGSSLATTNHGDTLQNHVQVANGMSRAEVAN